MGRDPEIRDTAQKRLSAIGIDEARIAAICGDGLFELSLSEDADIALVLWGVDGVLGRPWRLISHGVVSRMHQDKSLGAKVNGYYGKGVEESLDVLAYRLDNNNRLVKVGEGDFYHAGWQYSAVGDFIQGYAYEAEMRNAGASKKLIADYREVLTNAPEMAMGVEVEVTRHSENTYCMQNADSLAKLVGAWDGQESPPEAFRFSLHTLDTADVYYLDSLSIDQLKWVMPTKPVLHRKQGCFF